MLKAVHFTDIIHVHSHNFHILTGNLVRGGWMLLEGNQRQKFQNEINIFLGITLCILCSLFMIYYYILYLGWFEFSYIHYVLLFRVPARMVVRRPAPINQLFNDESIAVQI